MLNEVLISYYHKGTIILCCTAGNPKSVFTALQGNAVQVSTHSYICSGQSVLSERHVFLYNLANFRRNKREIIFSLKKDHYRSEILHRYFLLVKNIFYCEKHCLWDIFSNVFLLVSTSQLHFECSKVIYLLKPHTTNLKNILFQILF